MKVQTTVNGVSLALTPDEALVLAEYLDLADGGNRTWASGGPTKRQRGILNPNLLRDRLLQFTKMFFPLQPEGSDSPGGKIG